MKRLAITCLVIALSTLITTGTVKAIQILGADIAVVGELQTGSLTVGEQGVGGVTFFNGTIINDTTQDDGSDNPVTFGDNVRIDGRVYRGATAGATDTKPFVVDDNMEVVGSLTVGSITGLSNMVSAAGFAKTTDLAPYAKTTDLAPYAKTTDLAPYAKTTDLAPYAKTTDLAPYAKTTDLANYASTASVDDLNDDVGILISNQDAIYNYNRCTLNLGQYYTYPAISEMLFCWDLWMGTSLTASVNTSIDLRSIPEVNLDEQSINSKLQVEMRRVAELNK